MVNTLIAREGQPITVDGLVKRYGPTVAVDDLSFTVQPGVVTGFLGPNGAGKTTTMRLILGLDLPSSGRIAIGGRRYIDLPAPLREVGAVIDAAAVHPKRTGRNHLKGLARSNAIDTRRVQEVLEIVGMADVGDRRAGGYSLGMKQRLGIAAALLGDPPVLLFDEPVNGLDPEGIVWIRQFMRALAGAGRTVLVSSHLMSEMAQTADHLIVIGRGKLLRDESIRAFLDGDHHETVLVRAQPIEELTSVLEGAGAQLAPGPDGAVTVTGLDATSIGDLAAEHGIAIHELTPQRASLEEAFMDITRDAVEYQSTATHAATNGTTT